MTLRSITLGTGQHQLETSSLGYGAMSLAGAYGAISAADSLKLLDHVAESEVTFLDTANIYGDGESERVLGAFLKHRREEFVLASKVGIEKGAGVGRRRARGGESRPCPEFGIVAQRRIQESEEEERHDRSRLLRPLQEGRSDQEFIPGVEQHRPQS